jgi:hypothetical protein
MTTYRSNNERGFALAASVFALVIIAALVAGAFFAARQEMQIGVSSRTYQRAFAAAEAGLNNVIAQWNTGSLNSLDEGDSATLSASLPDGGSYQAVVRRLNDELFLLRSTGTDPTGTAERRLAAITRLQLVQMDFNAALTSRGDIKLGGSSFIDGVDQNPTGWSCPTGALDTLAGITTPNPNDITTSGCKNYSCVQGDPKILEDPTINDSTFFKFGDTDWNELVAMATLVLPAGATWNGLAPVGDATSCNTSVQTNWGEPYIPPLVAGCSNYYPIIYVPGYMKITGGRGQGILLVEGDLEVQGGAEFYGPVIVRGTLNTAGTGGHFNGGVMAANVNLDLSSVLGDALITYSSCAILKALQGSAPGRLIRQRSWAELF